MVSRPQAAIAAGSPVDTGCLRALVRDASPLSGNCWTDPIDCKDPPACLCRVAWPSSDGDAHLAEPWTAQPDASRSCRLVSRWRGRAGHAWRARTHWARTQRASAGADARTPSQDGSQDGTPSGLASSATWL